MFNQKNGDGCMVGRMDALVVVVVVVDEEED